MPREYVRYSDEPGYWRLMDYLRDACENAKPIPPYDELADGLLIPRPKIRRYISAMSKTGEIRVQGQNAEWRVIWLETGQTSAPRGRTGVPEGGYINDKRMHDVKQFLRRFYANVYDSRVTGGPRGFVEIDGVGRVTEAEAVELAQKKGWAG